MKQVVSLIVLAALHGAAAAAPVVPAQLDKAEEIAALPGGGWLALDKRGLRLVDAGGAERASLPIRAEHLDLRPL